MKKLFFVLTGSILFGTVFYYLISFVASWYTPRYIRSDSDMGNAIMASLLANIFGIFMGGAVGYALSKKT